MADGTDQTERIEGRIEELEIKLAFQDHKIAALDELVRSLADRLDKTQRDLTELQQTVKSPEVPVGPASELPPHY